MSLIGPLTTEIYYRTGFTGNTDRQTDTQTDAQIDRQTHTQIETYTVPKYHIGSRKEMTNARFGLSK